MTKTNEEKCCQNDILKRSDGCGQFRLFQSPWKKEFSIKI